MNDEKETVLHRLRTYYPEHPVCIDAANEIERLLAANRDVMLHFETLKSDYDRAQGEAKVMRDLLALALDVVKTCEGETAPECEALMELQNQIVAVLRNVPTCTKSQTCNWMG